MQMDFAAYDRVSKVETMLPKFQERFPPSPEDVHGAAYQVQNLANLYRERGEPDKAVEVIVNEIRRLPDDAPYRSWMALPRFLETFEAAGKKDLAVDLMKKGKDVMEGLRKKSSPGTSPNLPDGYYRIEDFFLLGGYRPEMPETERFEIAVTSIHSALEEALGKLE